MIFIILFLFFSTNSLFSAQPIDVKALKIRYSQKRQMIIATGNVEISSRGTNLYSDTAFVDMNKQVIQLTGNAKIIWNDGRILKSDKLIYFVKTQKGFSFKTHGFYAPWYYSAQSARTLIDTEIFIKNGTLSTCDKKKPHYYFEMTKMKIFPKDKIVAKNVFMIIDDMPVFYLPFTLFSLRDKSAFWQFKGGYSQYNGYLFENRFRLFDGRIFKLMYAENYYSLIGLESKISGGIDYKKTNIVSRISWMTNNDTFDKMTGKAKSKKNEFFIKTYGKWRYKRYFNINGSMNYASSKNYISGTYLSNPSFEIKNSEITSFLNTNYRYKRLGASLYAMRMYYWNAAENGYLPLLEVLPRANFYISSIRLLRKPGIFFNFSGNYSHNTNHTLTKKTITNLFSTRTSFNNNQRFMRFISLNSGVSHSFSYNNMRAEKFLNKINLNENLDVTIPFLQERISYLLSRSLFDTGIFGNIQTHSISNNLSIRLGNTSITHRFSYNIMKDTFGLELIQVRYFNKWFTFNTRLSKIFAKYGRNSIKAVNSGLNLKFDRKINISSNFSLNKTADFLPISISLRIHLQPTKKWDLSYATSFTSSDINTQPLIQMNNSLTIQRDLHCWIMQIYYHSFRGGSGAFDEWWVLFKIKKLNIFNIKLISQRGRQPLR